MAGWGDICHFIRENESNPDSTSIQLLCGAKENIDKESHQRFEEHRDLAREHRQVKEPCGDLVIVLR